MISHWNVWWRKKAYRSEEVIFLPSSSHEISGTGLPEATHLSETLGPGCRVRSVNVDWN